MDTAHFVEDFDENEPSNNHFTYNQVEWSDMEDLNLDVANLSTFSHPFAEEQVPKAESEVFHDCSSVLLTIEGENQEQHPLQECSTIFDVSLVTAP